MAAPFDAELMARTRAGDQGSLTLLIFSGLGVNRGIDPKGIFRVQQIGDLFLPALSRKLPGAYQAIINGARPDLLRRAPGKGVGRGGRALALELASLRLRARGSVLFEAPRKVNAGSGRFKDWFGPFEVHVYRFRK